MSESLDTRSFIERYKAQRRDDKLRFEEVPVTYNVAGLPLIKCRDAKLLNGRYPNMTLTTVYLFNPNYLTYLIRNENVDPLLKSIANEVIQNQTAGSGNIDREIAFQ